MKISGYVFNFVGHNFEGPFTSKKDLKNLSGVYVVLGKNLNKYSLIDVGESGNVRERVENHDREDCWLGQTSFPEYAVLYTPYETQAFRRKIEKEIRERFNPPCGTH